MHGQADAAGKIDWAGAALDATHVKAHRSATGARQSLPKAEKRETLSDEWLGRSRGGRTSKIHLCVEGHGRPLSLLMTASQCADVRQLLTALNFRTNLASTF